MAKHTKKEKGPMTKETKEVALKGNSAVAEAGVAEGSWGAEGLDKQDLMLGKILLMQGLSKLVSGGKAMVGDIIHSVNGSKLGNKDHPVEIIPIATFKTWVVSKKPKGGNKFEYEATLPMTAENAHLDLLETDEDGSEIRRDRTINFYTLLVSEVAEGTAIPCVLSCRRTSYTAGKKIANHFAKMQMLRQPPAAKSLRLTCRLETNDDGSFYVFDVEQGRNSTKEEITTAYDWYQVLSKGQHKVDDSDLKVAPAEETAAAEPGPSQY